MSLNASLSIAVQSLNAASGALQVTNNNIANANTPGYTRKVPIFQSATPTDQGNNLSLGNGVSLVSYQSVRDELLQSQVQQETTAQSGANAELSSMQQIQPTFTTSTQDIGTEMSALFKSLSTLSTDPTSASSREAVVTAGQNLTDSFNTASSTLKTQQAGLNTQVTQDVNDINQLTKQIAALNPQIASLKATGQDGGTLQDQQDQLVLSLSKLTNVAVTQSRDGVTLTTGNGTALVIGSQSFDLKSATGNTVQDQNGTDITSTLTSGDLGGTLKTRDTTIKGLQTQLDTLANQFATAMNTAQKSGKDQNGATGTDIFKASGSATTITASNITMAFTDSTKIAASSDGSSGSNGNLANLSAVQTNKLGSGLTPGSAYANLVYQVGSLTSNAQAESDATTSTLTQLNDQISSVSGVSIDEESANLLTYQLAYQAAARVVSTIQELFQVTMSMGTAGAA
jgi:flagellar hook-associated protein 1 FlgK